MKQKSLFYTSTILLSASIAIAVPNNEQQNFFNQELKKVTDQFITLSPKDFLQKTQEARATLPELVQEYFKKPNSLAQGIVHARKTNSGKTSLEAIAFEKNLE